MAQQRLTYSTLDVFTQTKYEGNPLAVVDVPAGFPLSQEQKQRIAREFNYSETVFLHARASLQEPWKIDIFTTFAELPFAGHPTIGTACRVLSSLTGGSNNDSGGDGRGGGGDGIRTGAFVTKAGEIALRYDAARGAAQARIPHNTHRHAEPVARETLLAMQPCLERFSAAGGGGGCRGEGVVFSIVKGMTFVLIELGSLDALGELRAGGHTPEVALDKEWDEPHVGAYFYVKGSESGDGRIGLRTRMMFGIEEDPATGSAACSLAAFLSLQEGRPGETRRFNVVQGVEMGRRSEIGVDVMLSDGGGIDSITLSGSAVEVMEGSLKV